MLALGIPGLGQQLLKQSTASTINVGPFIDDTDFKTLETALTVTGMTVKIIKHSDTFSSTVTSFSPTASGGSNDAQHVASGMYNLELTTTNTDTLGRLEVVVTVAGALPVFHRFEVIGSTPYETQVTSTASIDDLMETDCSTIASTTSPMGKICTNLNEKLTDYSSIRNRTTIATLASQTSFTLTAGSGDDNAYNGWLIYVQDQTSPDQYAAGVVDDYTGSTKTITLRTDPAIFTMATSDIVYLVPDRSLKSTVDNRTLDVTTTGGAGVDWANVEAPTTTLALTGTTISTSQAITSVSGNVAGSVASVTGAVGSVTGLTASDVGAIKTKTDYLPSATAGAAGGVFIAGTNAATTVTTAFSTTFTGNLTGSVASVTGAVGSVAGNVDGNVTGNVTGTLGGMTAAALKDFFDTDTTTTYASAVAGSVVKEITDNSAAGASDALATGTADSGSTTTMVDAARTEADNDYWKGRLICFTSGNVSGQCAHIEDFVASTDTFTFKPALTQAVATQNYKIFADASVWDETLAEHLVSGTTGNSLNSAASAGDPWGTALPGAYGAGTAGKILGDNLNATVSSRAAEASITTAQADLDDIQTRIPASLVSGRMDSSTGAMAANVLTASAINADAFTAAKFAADVATEFATTLMTTTYEGTTTFKNFLQYGSSALFGKYNSASGTFNFRDIADSKNRIVYTTSSTARTAVTLSPD